MIIVSILSAIFGACVALFANWWRTKYTIKAQDFSKRIEELNSIIASIEDDACNYWIETDRSKNFLNHIILGKQIKIEKLLEHLDVNYQNFKIEPISEALGKFINACTGGSFNSINETAEPNRIRSIMATGEDLKIKLFEVRFNKY